MANLSSAAIISVMLVDRIAVPSPVGTQAVDHVVVDQILGAVVTAHVFVVEPLDRRVVERLPHLAHQAFGERVCLSLLFKTYLPFFL
jgi:hypothetical protein